MSLLTKLGSFSGRNAHTSAAKPGSRKSTARLRGATRLEIESLEGRIVLAAPTAVNDSYATVGGAQLVVAPSGVLNNDTDPENDAMRAVLVDNVDHGTLALNPNGGFTYTPTPGYFGPDSFQYRAQTDGPITFTVDQNLSTVNVNATVRTASFGSQSDSDSTRLSGTVITKLTPGSAPFALAHVEDLDLTLVDALDFDFSFFFGAVRLSADAAPGSMHVTMETPGGAATITANAFNQTANDLRVTGQADLSCTGIACPTLPPNPQQFDNAGIITDIQGTLAPSGTNVKLTFPVNFTGTFDLGDGNFLDLNLSGNVVANGTTPAPTEQSNIATVNLQSLETVVARPEGYVVGEDKTLTVPATGALTEDLILPTGSLWKYLDTGTDQGTAWRATAFNDASWKGPVEAELGYGENDEGFVIDCGPGADGVCSPANGLNDNYITSYFRRKITLDRVNDINDLVIRLKRDDGAAVYINGVEVIRDNLAADAAYNTPSIAGAADDGQTFNSFTVPSSMLVVGTNVIAVEIHQQSGGSSDVSFDLEIRARRAQRGVLANDVNNAGGSLSAGLVSGPSHGSLTLNPDGSFTYTPTANYAGADSFTYAASTVAAPVVVGAATTVTINVEAEDDKPVGVGDGPYQATVGAPLVVPVATGVLANDTDVENGAKTAQVVAQPTKGTLTLASDGSFTYNATSAGADSFTYRAVQSATIVPFGAKWKVLDDGSDQTQAWRPANFNDAAWASGIGQLGYGDGDETTLIRYGSSQSNKHITTYFRKEFNVTDAAAVIGLVARVIRDDGVAVYLNGTEIGRDNLAAGAAFNTLAGPTSIDAAGESTPVEFTINPALLVAGRNVLAVEMHQASVSSSDLSFDLQLVAQIASAVTTASINSTGSTPAPQVDSVTLSGSQWNAAFTQALTDGGFGQGAYSVPSGAAQTSPLPWAGVDTIRLTFTQPLLGTIAGTLTGAAAGSVSLTGPIISSGPGGTTFAVWNVAGGQSLAADRYTFTLDDAATNGSGVALDGDWTTGVTAFPSGNGSAGGDFAFQFRVIPGDVDRDGDVDAADRVSNSLNQFAAAGSAGYLATQDVDANGKVNFVDLIRVRNAAGSAAPSAPASLVARTAPRSSSPSTITAASRTRTATTARRAAAVDEALSEIDASAEARLSVAHGRLSLRER